MAANTAVALLSSPLLPPSIFNPSPPPFPPFYPRRPFPPPSQPLAHSRLSSLPPFPGLRHSFPLKPAPRRPNHLLCTDTDPDLDTDYKFPDPIPAFATAETDKFRAHMLKRLTKKKKEYFEDSVEEIVDVCTEIFSNFLHTEYGGPGTLLVLPFIDMADTLRERKLPGAAPAARIAVVWAQKHVDKDWKEWTSGNC